MNFCGTLGRYDGKFLTFALRCIVLMDPLMELEDYRHCVKTNRVDNFTKSWRRIDPTSLFPIPAKDREDYAKFAANLKHFLPEELNALAKSRLIFARRHEFEDYEFYQFFDYIYKNLRVENVLPRIEDLEKVGNGVPLEDYHPLLKFLSALNAHGLHEHHNQRGGCF